MSDDVRWKSVEMGCMTQSSTCPGSLVANVSIPWFAICALEARQWLIEIRHEHLM
jgi:hypothetical protein